MRYCEVLGCSDNVIPGATSDVTMCWTHHTRVRGDKGKYEVECDICKGQGVVGSKQPFHRFEICFPCEGKGGS